ncbi:hypothetical protein [Cupriavidus sp. TMH.W2]|uniref:hypothetical protein n=1 Tax=Cupriavidus sp. TMH.W2 TaxID=3434465 RepID=UPI003D771278
MKFATIATSSGEVLTVTADGNPLGKGDVDRRVLHIRPKLFVPKAALAHLNYEEVELTVTTTLGIDITPPGGVQIRQPYPNRRYFVGGSTEMRNGWVVPIPEGVAEFDIQFAWLLNRAWLWAHAEGWECRQLIHVQLLPGEGRTYTMDATCWPRDAQSAGGRSAISLVGHQEDEDLGAGNRDIVREANLVVPDQPDMVVGHYIQERLAIPPIYYEQAWSIQAFQEEQIHEVKHVTFTKFSDSHRQNGSVEMPASILLEAIELARSIPVEKGSAYANSVAGQPGGLESHPALKLLNDWWDQHRRDGHKMKVGSCQDTANPLS